MSWAPTMGWNKTPASTQRSSPDAPDVCRRRWRDTTPERSVYSRRRRRTIPPSDPVLPRPRVADDFSRPLPAPPIDEAGWGVPVAVGTRALGRARGIDARNFEAGRALVHHASSDPECAFTDDAVARRPRNGAPRRLPAARFWPTVSQPAPGLGRKNQSADGQIRGRSASRSGFPNWAHTVFVMLTHHAGIFSTEETEIDNRPGGRRRSKRRRNLP